MLLDWQRLGIDGARLRPAVNATDLPVIVDEVVPLLQRAGRFRTELSRRRNAARAARPAGRIQPLRDGGEHRDSALDPGPGADQRRQRRRDGAAQHHRPGAARRAVGVSPVLDRRASLRRRCQFGAGGADRPNRGRYQHDSGGRGRRTAGLHHGRRGGREFRHARSLLSRPHRPGRRPAGSAVDSGFKPKQPRRTPTAAAVARGRRRGDSAAVRPAWPARHGTVAGQPWGSCSSPRRCRPTSPSNSRDILAMLDGTYEVDGFRRARGARRAIRIDAVDLWQHQGTKRAVGRRARAAVRRELSHHSGHRTGGHRRLPRHVRPVGQRCRSPTSWCLPTSSSPKTAPPHTLWPAGYGHWVYSIRTGVGAMPYPRSRRLRSAAPTSSCRW